MSYIVGFEGKFVPDEHVPKYTMDEMADKLDDQYDEFTLKHPEPETQPQVPEEMPFQFPDFLLPPLIPTPPVADNQINEFQW